MEHNKSAHHLQPTTQSTADQQAEFDQYAENYSAELKGLSITGEGKEYFAHRRIVWVRDQLARLPWTVKTVMDFGCGTGSSTPFFFDVLKVERVLGVDVSLRSLEIAKREHGSEQAQFMLLDQYQPAEQIDFAFCNGVFHHIPPNQRAASVNYVYRSLRPGGVFAFWENSPWNPLTRIGMAITSFDKDAIMLSPPGARRLLRAGSFDIVRTDFLFIFPKLLSGLRWIEPRVSNLPIGGQYLVFCRKPF